MIDLSWLANPKRTFVINFGVKNTGIYVDSRKWFLSKRSIKMWPEFSSSMMIQGRILILFTVFDSWFLNFLFNVPSLKFHFRFLTFDFPLQWWSFKLVWHTWYPSYSLNFWNLKLDFRLWWVNWSVPWLIFRTEMSEKRNTTRKKWIFPFTGKSLTKFRLSLKMIPMTLWKPLFWRDFFDFFTGQEFWTDFDPTPRWTHGVPICWHNNSPFSGKMREDIVSSYSKNENLHRPCATKVTTFTCLR